MFRARTQSKCFPLNCSPVKVQLLRQDAEEPHHADGAREGPQGRAALRLRGLREGVQDQQQPHLAQGGDLYDAHS